MSDRVSIFFHKAKQSQARKKHINLAFLQNLELSRLLSREKKLILAIGAEKQLYRLGKQEKCRSSYKGVYGSLGATYRTVTHNPGQSSEVSALEKKNLGLTVISYLAFADTGALFIPAVRVEPEQASVDESHAAQNST